MSDQTIAFLIILAWFVSSLVLIYFALFFAYGPLYKAIKSKKIREFLYGYSEQHK